MFTPANDKMDLLWFRETYPEKLLHLMPECDSHKGATPCAFNVRNILYQAYLAVNSYEAVDLCLQDYILHAAFSLLTYLE